MNNRINDEIDLIEILKKIYNFKKIIFYTSIIFTFIGVAVAIISPLKFSSSTVFIPQNIESSTSNFSGVASLVGINLGSFSSGNDIPTSMYPQIGNSPKFKRLILEKIIDEKENLSLKNYLVEYYKIKDKKEAVSSKLEMTELEESCFEILNTIWFLF